MVEAIKMAARVAALTLLAVAAGTLVTAAVSMLVGIPSIAWILSGIGTAITFIEHWYGTAGGILIAWAGALFTFEIALLVYKGVHVVQAFLLRISEG